MHKQLSFYTRPAKALNAKAMMAAQIKAIGFPLKHSGISLDSNLSRTAAKITNTNKKPVGTAIELMHVSIKL